MQWYLERCVCVVWFMWNKQGWPDSKIICKARWLWYCSALWLLQIPWRYNIGLKMSFKSAETLPGQVKASRPYLPLLNSAQLTAKRLWFALWQGCSIGWHRNECVEVTNRPLMRESPDFKEKELFLVPQTAARCIWHGSFPAPLTPRKREGISRINRSKKRGLFGFKLLNCRHKIGRAQKATVGIHNLWQKSLTMVDYSSSRRKHKEKKCSTVIQRPLLSLWSLY